MIKRIAITTLLTALITGCTRTATEPSSTPWYTTGWAYAGYTLLTACILYAAWRIVMHRYSHTRLRKRCRRTILNLRRTNNELVRELEHRNAEIFSQSSTLLARNELISKIRDAVNEFNRKHNNQTFIPLVRKIDSLIDSNLDIDSDWRLFLIRFEQQHSGFFRILKEHYPDLTSSDLRLCACLRLHLGSKEIAALMNLTVRAVENSRYRLRRKLGLRSSQNLNDFLMSIDFAGENQEHPDSETSIL